MTGGLQNGVSVSGNSTFGSAEVDCRHPKLLDHNQILLKSIVGRRRKAVISGF